MSDPSRAVVASFLSVHKGQEKGVSRLTTATSQQDHPFIDAAYQYLQDIWTEVRSLSCAYNVQHRVNLQSAVQSRMHWEESMLAVP